MTPDQLEYAQLLSLLQRNVEAAQVNADSAMVLLRSCREKLEALAKTRPDKQQERPPAPAAPPPPAPLAISAPAPAPAALPAQPYRLPNLAPYVREFLDLKAGEVFTYADFGAFVRSKGLTGFSNEQLNTSVGSYYTNHKDVALSRAPGQPRGVYISLSKKK